MYYIYCFPFALLHRGPLKKAKNALKSKMNYS